MDTEQALAQSDELVQTSETIVQNIDSSSREYGSSRGAMSSETSERVGNNNNNKNLEIEKEKEKEKNKVRNSNTSNRTINRSSNKNVIYNPNNNNLNSSSNNNKTNNNNNDNTLEQEELQVENDNGPPPNQLHNMQSTFAESTVRVGVARRKKGFIKLITNNYHNNNNQIQDDDEEEQEEGQQQQQQQRQQQQQQQEQTLFKRIFKRNEGNSPDKLEMLKREVEMDEHIKSAEDVIQAFNSDAKKGLTSEQAADLLLKNGKNTLTPPSFSWILFILKNFFGGFQVLMWVASILCFTSYGLSPALATENLYVGIVLMVVALIAGTFTAVHEYASNKVMEGFKKLMPSEAVVIRDGEQKKILAEELVVGDIVEVKGGHKIPADMRLLKVAGLKVDNSSLTGETEPIARTTKMTSDNPLETKNIVFYSTLAVEGTAIGIVINTGDNSVIGRIAKLASKTKPKLAPIKKEINQFILIVSILSVIIGIIFLAIGFVKFGVADINSITKSVVFAIGIIVASAPSGLLAAVTVSFTLAVKRMAKKNVLVKNMEGIESLGATTTICSDKTGTLTQNRMTVSHMWYNKELFEANIEKGNESSKTFKKLHNIASLCNHAFFDAKNTAVGDASESALIRYFDPIYNIEDHRADFPLIDEIPFNSTNKWQISIRKNEKHDKYLILMKGAPERIIENCSHVMTENGPVKITKKWKNSFTETYEKLGSLGERVLGFCQQELDSEAFPMDEYKFNTASMNWPQKSFVFVGLISLVDPPREGVAEAIEKCKSASIRVIMVTGDHPHTALAIARQVGIIQGKTREEVAKEEGISIDDVDSTKADGIIVTGNDLREMDSEQLDQVLDYKEIVFARTSPQQKLIIVEGCQRRGEIVTVTGDGVNDSPALKKADVGIAMGIGGSDVAKEAADMILMDDNFSTIVAGIEEGRIVFDNLKKSNAYLLTSKLPELLPFILFVLADIPLSLSAVLILCIDLGTDLWPAISLATEKQESDLMQRSPRDMKRDNLVTFKLVCFSFFQVGVIQAVAAFLMFFFVMYDAANHDGFTPGSLLGLSSQFLSKANSSDYDICRLSIAPGNRFLIGCATNSTYLDAITPSYLVPEDNVTLAFTRRNIVDYCYNSQHYNNELTCQLSNTMTREDLVQTAQTSYFLSIVITQIFDSLVTKTRYNSLFSNGMKNWWLNSGIIFELLLTCAIIYLPFMHIALKTAPIKWYWWGISIPFGCLILFNDEMRKLMLRRGGTQGWVYKLTYY